MNAEQHTLPYDKEAVYAQIYALDDPEFLAGIQSIIGPMESSGAPQDQIDQTRDRARVFFFSSKTGQQIDYDDYANWKAGKAKAPHPASFDAIVELIATGQTDKIPGIRDIPLKINEQEPTKPCLSRPSKPWEKASPTPEFEQPPSAENDLVLRFPN